MLICVLSFPSAPSENERGDQVYDRLMRCSRFWCLGVLFSEIWLISSGCPVMLWGSSSAVCSGFWNTQLRSLFGGSVSSPLFSLHGYMYYTEVGCSLKCGF